MSKLYNTELQQRVQGYIQEIGSQTQAADNMGVGKTRLGLWLKSNYDKGNIERLEQQLSEFFREACHM